MRPVTVATISVTVGSQRWSVARGTTLGTPVLENEDQDDLYPIATLTANGCKARYGIAYLRAICSQAGVGLTETAPDEDVLAVDCAIEYAESSVRVQVKCTSNWKISGSSITYEIEDGWVRNWDKNFGPVYFLVVLVPPKIEEWLNHHPNGTYHATAAYWVRLEKGKVGKTLTVPKDQRLSVDTIATWHEDMLAAYAGGS